MQNEILFATTALVATASVAAADVTVGGFGYIGAIYDDATSSTNVEHAARITFSASVETDSGMSLAVSSRITTADGDDNGQLGHNKVTVKTNGLTIAAGATHGAMKSLARSVAFYGFNNGGVSAVDNNNGMGDGDNNVYVSYALGAATLGVSADAAFTGTEVALAYSAGNMGFGVGMNNDSDWMAKVSYTAGDLSVTAGTNSDDKSSLVLGYSMTEATSLGLGMQDATAGSSYAFDVSHDLGGATLSATVGESAAGATEAGLGIQFNF